MRPIQTRGGLGHRVYRFTSNFLQLIGIWTCHFSHEKWWFPMKNGDFPWQMVIFPMNRFNTQGFFRGALPSPLHRGRLPSFTHMFWVKWGTHISCLMGASNLGDSWYPGTPLISNTSNIRDPIQIKPETSRNILNHQLIWQLSNHGIYDSMILIYWWLLI